MMGARGCVPGPVLEIDECGEA